MGGGHTGRFDCTSGVPFSISNELQHGLLLGSSEGYDRTEAVRTCCC